MAPAPTKSRGSDSGSPALVKPTCVNSAYWVIPQRYIYRQHWYSGNIYRIRNPKGPFTLERSKDHNNTVAMLHKALICFTEYTLKRIGGLFTLEHCRAEQSFIFNSF